MTVKSLIHPVTGAPLFMGRNRPTPAKLASARRLRFSAYTRGVPLPAAKPGPYGYLTNPAIADVIAQMYANDSMGDCTMAAKYKLIGGWKGLVNPPSIVFPVATVTADYLRMTGGQDTGLDEITVLEDWRDNPALGTSERIKAFMSIDASVQSHVELAIDLCINGYLGISLPDAWVARPPSGNGFVWDVAGDPDENNGHCVPAIDCDANGIKILTWGMWGTITWPAVAKYLVPAAGGEFHVVLTDEIISTATAKAPAGVDVAALAADYQAIAA